MPKQIFSQFLISLVSVNQSDFTSLSSCSAVADEEQNDDQS